MENNTQPKTIKFADIKQRLIDVIKEKLPKMGVQAEPVTLVDGFINQPISMELSGAFVVGGPAVPMVMVVGNNTGRVYLFALKALLPDIDKIEK